MCFKKWSRPDELIVFFSKMVGYYHGFFYQVYALCSTYNDNNKFMQTRIKEHIWSLENFNFIYF